MFYLVYTSSAAQFFSQDDLESLLNQARAKNASLDISGILLYKSGHFLQLLEGNKEAVQSVYSKIIVDPRHQNVSTIVEDEESERMFTDWSMAFCKIEGIETPAEGYNDFLNLPLTGHELEHYLNLPERLLLLFKRNQS